MLSSEFQSQNIKNGDNAIYTIKKRLSKTYFSLTNPKFSQFIKLYFFKTELPKKIFFFVMSQQSSQKNNRLKGGKNNRKWTRHKKQK